MVLSDPDDDCDGIFLENNSDSDGNSSEGIDDNDIITQNVLKRSGHKIVQSQTLRNMTDTIDENGAETFQGYGQHIDEIESDETYETDEVHEEVSKSMISDDVPTAGSACKVTTPIKRTSSSLDFIAADVWKKRVALLDEHAKFAYARDVSDKNAKNFCDVHDHEDFIRWKISLPRDVRNFYEVIKEGRACKLYFDIETDRAHEGPLDKHTARSILIEIMELVRTNVSVAYPEEGLELEQSDWAVLDSSNEAKTSFHLILVQGFVFESIEHMKRFIENKTLFPANTMKRLRVDMGVYKKNQSLRMCASAKRGDKDSDTFRPLRVERCPGFTDSDITKANVCIVSDDKTDSEVLIKVLLSCALTHVKPELRHLAYDGRKMNSKIKAAYQNHPEAHPEIPSNDDMLCNIALAIAENDPDTVCDYNKWIAMGLKLKSAGASSSVWHHFSKLGSKYDADACDEKWKSFTNNHDPSLLFNYARMVCPEAVAECEKSNLYNMSHLSYSIAYTLSHRYGKKYLYEPDDQMWYFLDGTIWKKDPSKMKISEAIIEFLKDVGYVVKTLKQKSKNGPSDEDVKKEDGTSNASFDNTQFRIENFNKILEKCQNGSLGQNNWHVLQVAFARYNFVQKLDSVQHLLSFGNGILDLEGSYVKNDMDQYIMEPMTDEDGDVIEDFTGHPIMRRKKDPNIISIRDPDMYTDAEGNEHMEYVSMSTGYNWYSKADLQSSSPREYKRLRKIELRIMAYLEQVFPDKEEMNYMIDWLATCLNGDINPQLIHFWTGINPKQNGSNSKGILTKIVSSVFGEYFATCKAELLTSPDGGASGANSALMVMINKRIVMFNELQASRPLQAEFIKSITGDDEISGRELYGKQRTFMNHAKLAVAANEIPMPTQTDDGFWRRLRVVPFMAKFVDDPSDPQYEKIRKDKHGNVMLHKKEQDMKSRISSWKLPFMWILVDRYIEMSKRGKDFALPRCKEIRKYTRKYETMVDVVKEWLFDIVVQDPNSYVTFVQLKEIAPDEVRRLYQRDMKLRTEIEKVFGEPKHKGRVNGERVHGYHWAGYRLRNIADDADSDED